MNARNYYRRGWLITILALSLFLGASPGAAQPPPTPLTVENAAELELLATLGAGYYTDMAVDPTQMQVAVASSHSVRIFSVPDLDLVLDFEPRGTVAALTYAPDGATLVTGDETGRVTRWNLGASTIEEIDTLQQSSAVTALSYAPDMAFIAAGGADGSLHIWDLRGPWLAAVLHEGQAPIRALAFAPDARQLAALDAAGHLRTWDLRTWTLVPALFATDATGDVVFAPNGEWLLFGHQDYTVRVWDVATAREIGRLEGHFDEVRSIALSEDSEIIATGSRDGTVRVWSGGGWNELATLEAHTYWVEDVGVMMTISDVVSGGWDDTVRLWQPAQEVNRLQDFSGAFRQVLVAETLVGAVTLDGTLYLWHDLESITSPLNAVRVAALSEDGQWLATVAARSNIIELWDTTTLEVVQRLEAPGMVSALVFSPDGRTLVTNGGDANSALVWDVSSGEVTREVASDAPSVPVAHYGGALLAVAGDAATLTPMRVPTGGLDFDFGAPLYDARLVLDGAAIVATTLDDPNVWVMDVASREITPLASDGEPVLALAVGADGRLLATAGADGAVRLWDVEAGELLHVLEGHRQRVTGLAFTPDGSQLYSASEDGTVRLWGLP